MRLRNWLASALIFVGAVSAAAVLSAFTQQDYAGQKWNTFS